MATETDRGINVKIDGVDLKFFNVVVGRFENEDEILNLDAEKLGEKILSTFPGLKSIPSNELSPRLQKLLILLKLFKGSKNGDKTCAETLKQIQYARQAFDYTKQFCGQFRKDPTVSKYWTLSSALLALRYSASEDLAILRSLTPDDISQRLCIDASDVRQAAGLIGIYEMLQDYIGMREGDEESTRIFREIDQAIGIQLLLYGYSPEHRGDRLRNIAIFLCRLCGETPDTIGNFFGIEKRRVQQILAEMRRFLSDAVGKPRLSESEEGECVEPETAEDETDDEAEDEYQTETTQQEYDSDQTGLPTEKRLIYRGDMDGNADPKDTFDWLEDMDKHEKLKQDMVLLGQYLSKHLPLRKAQDVKNLLARNANRDDAFEILRKKHPYLRNRK